MSDQPVQYLKNWSHGQNLRPTPGQAAPIAQYFFKNYTTVYSKNTFTLLYLFMHTGIFLRIFTYRDICMNVNFTIFLRKYMDKWHKSYTL